MSMDPKEFDMPVASFNPNPITLKHGAYKGSKVTAS